MYYLINGLVLLAMIFFFFLPMTDYKTARMKLCVVCALAVVRRRRAGSMPPRQHWCREDDRNRPSGTQAKNAIDREGPSRLTQAIPSLYPFRGSGFLTRTSLREQ
jgi:hypothetical protein